MRRKTFIMSASLALTLALCAASGHAGPAPREAAPAAPARDVAAQRAAMAKLSFLHGKWIGENRATRPDGSVMVTLAEDEIAPLLDGMILTIKGRAYAPGQKPGGPYAGENYGVFMFDETTGKLALNAYSNGAMLTGTGRMTGQAAAEWTLEGPGHLIRFTARADGPDGWIETGEFSTDGGATWGGRFEIKFRRAN